MHEDEGVSLGVRLNDMVDWRRAIAKAAIVLALAVMLGSVATLCVPAPALAVEPQEVLSDKALEARARGLSAKLRCLVCQNQSIDDSNAPLAKDLRLVVRERLTKGESDEAVLSYVVARYGEFVLLTPPFKVSTLLLWIAPLLCLVGIGYALLGSSGLFAGTRPTAALPGAGAADRLSTDEEKRLKALLDSPSGRTDRHG